MFSLPDAAAMFSADDMLTNFLEPSGISLQAGNATSQVSRADLADKAKSISVFLKCAP